MDVKQELIFLDEVFNLHLWSRALSLDLKELNSKPLLDSQ